MTLRINGGIAAGQNIAGNVLYFKLTMSAGDFDYTVSDGTITILPFASGQGQAPQKWHLVNNGESVPKSAADLALIQIQDKCTILTIGLVETSSITNEIHIAVEGAAFGWVDGAGAVDVAAMQAAINALGVVTVPTTHSGAVDTPTIAPVTTTVDLNDAVVAQASFELV